MSIQIHERPFIDSAPSVVHAVEIFAGEWACSFPAGFPAFRGSGSAAAFDDPRIKWANEMLLKHGLGFNKAKILELGPLEAAHTYMISRYGAEEIISVENNTRAYLKCLVVKEVLEIKNTKFLLGDAVRFLEQNTTQYDVGLASAFLNHFVNPVEVIARLAKCSNSMFIWNVVFDESLFTKQPEMRPTFGPPKTASYEGFKHTLYPHTYGQVTDYSTFWGGSQPSCCWMVPEDILAAVKYFGYNRVEYKIEDNPFGKALYVLASK